MPRKSNVRCVACELPVYQRPKERALGRRAFCSVACYNPHRYRKKPLTCPLCGGPFKSGAASDAKYCSRACSNRARTGIKYDGTWSASKVVSHPKLKEAVRQRDGDKCQMCGIPPVWQGKRLVLQLDHIDGDRRNRAFGNFRLLCPNCHSQTETFGARKTVKISEGPAEMVRQSVLKTEAPQGWGFDSSALRQFPCTS